MKYFVVGSTAGAAAELAGVHRNAVVRFFTSSAPPMPGLRTTNRCIFVIGGVVGGYQFAYVAGYHAEIVIHNMLECCDALGDILLY